MNARTEAIAREGYIAIDLQAGDGPADMEVAMPPDVQPDEIAAAITALIKSAVNDHDMAGGDLMSAMMAAANDLK